MSAQKFKKNNFSPKKGIEKLECIETCSEEHATALAKVEGNPTALAGKMAEQEARKVQYQQMQQYLKHSEEV